MKYAVVIEEAGRNFSAYVPDLPGCIATGRTLPEVRRHLREAIAFHIDGLRTAGLAVPKSRTRCEQVVLKRA
ncbi:MAG: type II toxin-antitoxin system HicB family antitoxin [Planctomycetes bacterium]|nr:type II toxin-antitoxin system HicB family antitoxin [Planctomycetota bacterium]